jgi:hypothetical protein
MLASVRAFLAVWTLIVAAGMFRGCGPLPTPTTSPTVAPAIGAAPTAVAFPEGAPVLTIAHTNDVRGEVDPCG